MQRACKSKSKPPLSKTKPKPKSVAQVQGEEKEEEEPDDYTLQMVKSLRKSDAPPILVKVKLDDCPVDMEVDTGAAISLMSESTFNTLWPRRSLQPSSVRL